MKTKIHLIILIILVLSAGFARFYHFDFGLPKWNLFDEKRAIRQTMNFYNGDYIVNTFNHPPLIKYCALILLKSYNLINPIEKKDLHTLTNKSLRLVSVIAGTLAVLIMYLLAREFLTPALSLITASIYAFLPITVFISKHGIPDTLLSFMFILNFYLIIRLYKKKTLFLYALNGFFLALGVVSKYNAVFLYGSFLTAHFFAAKQEDNFMKFFFDWKKIALFLSTTTLGLSIGLPTVLGGVEFNNFMNSLFFEKKHLFGNKNANTHNGVQYYYIFHFIKSIFPITGPVLLSFIIAGIFYIIKRHNKPDIIILVSFLPYYFAIEHVYKINVAPDRYVLPIVSVYILCALIFCDKLIKFLHRKFKIKKSLLTIILTILLAFYPFIKTANLLASFVPDTRDRMADWINENIPAKSVFFYPLKRFDYYPVLSQEKYPLGIPQYHMERSNVDYVPVTSFGYQNVRKLKLFYENLKNCSDLVYTINPAYQSYLLHNPTIELYKIRRQ